MNAAVELWREEISPSSLQEWFNRTAYGIVVYSYYEDPEEKIAILKSDRTKEDEKLFYETLKSINYDNGYGLQQLFGEIVFKDGSWLSRREYDGSEWWRLNKCPSEEDVFEGWV